MKNGIQMTREELMAALQNAKKGLQKVRMHEQVIEQQMASVVDHAERTEEKNLASRFSGSFTIAGLILKYFGWCIVSTVITLIYFLPVGLIKGQSGNTIMDNAVYTGMVLAIFLMFAGKPLLRFLRNKRLEKHTGKAENVIREAESSIDNYVSSHPEIFGFLPKKYARTHVIDSMLEYLETFRADNLRDAMNLYEQELRAA